MEKKVSLGVGWLRAKAYEYQGTQYEADVKDGDIVTILDAGQIVQGQYGEQKAFKIKTRNDVKLISLNQVSQNNLIDEFGDESENWIDKDVKVWVIKAMVKGKMSNVVYLSGLEATMDDEGRFSRKGGDVDIETIESEEDLSEMPDFSGK